MEALEAEREQKYELKKKLDEKLSNDAMINMNNFGLRFPELTGFCSGKNTNNGNQVGADFDLKNALIAPGRLILFHMQSHDHQCMVKHKRSAWAGRGGDLHDTHGHDLAGEASGAGDEDSKPFDQYSYASEKEADWSAGEIDKIQNRYDQESNDLDDQHCLYSIDSSVDTYVDRCRCSSDSLYRLSESDQIKSASMCAEPTKLICRVDDFEFSNNFSSALSRSSSLFMLDKLSLNVSFDLVINSKPPKQCRTPEADRGSPLVVTCPESNVSKGSSDFFRPSRMVRILQKLGLCRKRKAAKSCFSSLTTLNADASNSCDQNTPKVTPTQCSSPICTKRFKTEITWYQTVRNFAFSCFLDMFLP